MFFFIIGPAPCTLRSGLHDLFFFSLSSALFPVLHKKALSLSTAPIDQPSESFQIISMNHWKPVQY